MQLPLQHSHHQHHRPNCRHVLRCEVQSPPWCPPAPSLSTLRACAWLRHSTWQNVLTLKSKCYIPFSSLESRQDRLPRFSRGPMRHSPGLVLPSKRLLWALIVVAYWLPPLVAWVAMGLLPLWIWESLPASPLSTQNRIPSAIVVAKAAGVAVVVGGVYALVRRALDAELTQFEPSVEGLGGTRHRHATRHARRLASRLNDIVTRIYGHRVKWGYFARFHREHSADCQMLHKTVASARAEELNECVPYTNIVRLVSSCMCGCVCGASDNTSVVVVVWLRVSTGDACVCRKRRHHGHLVRLETAPAKRSVPRRDSGWVAEGRPSARRESLGAPGVAWYARTRLDFTQVPGR